MQGKRSASEYDRLGESITEMDEKINAIRENISNTSVMKEKLESQIQILAEQIHTAEMTDEHLQSRLDAIARETEGKGGGKSFPTRKKKYSGDEQLAQVRKRQEEAAQTLAEIQKQIASCNEGMEQGRKNCLRC